VPPPLQARAAQSRFRPILLVPVILRAMTTSKIAMRSGGHAKAAWASLAAGVVVGPSGWGCRMPGLEPLSAGAAHMGCVSYLIQ